MRGKCDEALFDINWLSVVKDLNNESLLKLSSPVVLLFAGLPQLYIGLKLQAKTTRVDNTPTVLDSPTGSNKLTISSKQSNCQVETEEVNTLADIG